MEVISTDNIQPDLMFYGLRIGEPVTAFTGILIALVCFYAWLRLGKISPKNDSLKLYRGFLLLTGFSGLIGGLVGHAFLYAFPSGSKLPGFILGMVAVSVMVQASILRARPFLGSNLAKLITFLNIIELLVALWIVCTTQRFSRVEIHSAFGFLLVILPLETMLFLKTRAQGSQEILLGILLLVGAVLVHIFKISFGVWFTFFDLGHLFICAAIWKFMLASIYDNAAPSQSSLQ